MRCNVLLVFILLACKVARGEQPNIVFLLTDDQSTYSMGCYGNEDVHTPHLDQLAKEGVVFDRHYATTAICMASRATVMTGMYEYKTGCNFSHGEMLESTWSQSYPILMREAGYMTAFAGKFGFELRTAPTSKPLRLPADDFDKWGGGPGQTHFETKKNKSMASYAKEYPHSTLSYGAFGQDFIREAVDAKKPFCLSISFKAPHKPAVPDPRFDHVYKDAVFQKPANFGREAGAHFAAQSKTDRQYERFYSWNYADKYDKEMALYHQQVHGVDAAVGMIRAALKEQDVSENTVIIYTSDNGYFCGSHGYGSKVLPYEESSRVPMVILDPRKSETVKNERRNALTGLVDIAPTILKLAGLPVPANMDGKDLMTAYSDAEATIHSSLLLINVWGKSPTHALAVVTQTQKYIHWCFEDHQMKATEELYDLSSDPLELSNQVGSPEYQKALHEMRAEYDQYVELWKSDSVSYNNYEQYGQIFDRHLPWEKKSNLYRRAK